MRNSISGKGKRGFSSVVGSVFMVLIMSVLASSYFVYTLSQNTAYNTAVEQRNQLAESVKAENLQCENTTYTAYANNNVNINANITNTGSISVQFITLWICVTNNTWAGAYNWSKLTNANLQPGNVYSLSINLPVSGVIKDYNYSYASWLVTSKGNTVALQKQLVSSDNIIIAAVAQGIGSVSFNFEQFWHYDFNGIPAQETSLPSIAPQNYTVSKSKYNVFHVTITDFDLLKNDIILNGNSSMYMIATQNSGGSVKYTVWNLLNCTNGKLYPTSGVQVLLNYSRPTDVYFGCQMDNKIDAGATYPVNILLSGTKGSNDWGQNIPFVSLYVTS